MKQRYPDYPAQMCQNGWFPIESYRHARRRELIRYRVYWLVMWIGALLIMGDLLGLLP